MRAIITNSLIVIPASRLPGGTFSVQQSVDLAPFQGRSVRLYLDATGHPLINPASQTYWQIAETDLPAPQTTQAVTGSRPVTSTSTDMLARGTTATDALSLVAGQVLGMVGNAWAPYRLGTDYNVSSAGIQWLGVREPLAGMSYPVQIITTTSEPITTSTPIPLDLSAHPVTLFDLPQ